VGRVAGVLRDRHEAGLVEENAATEKLIDAIEVAATKFAAAHRTDEARWVWEGHGSASDDLDDLEYDSEEEDFDYAEDDCVDVYGDGRDFMGRRVKKFSDLDRGKGRSHTCEERTGPDKEKQ
jgi:hypothetical protein